MRILVTGSSGTIGTRLCETLLQSEHDIVCVDWEPNQWIPEIDAMTHRLDLRKKEEAMQMPGDVDIVIHLAANARVHELVENPDRAMDNFLSLFNTLEFARQNNVKRFVFASSRESYGNTPAEKYTEDMVRVENCESPYTASKVGGEALVHSYKACYDIDQVIIRFSNVYGMYDNSVRVVPQFIRRAKAGETLHVYGREKNLDFTYIDDAIQGITRIINQFDTAKGNTLNLAYGNGTTLVTLAETVKELLQSSSEIEVGNPRVGEVIHYVADVSKAKELLGYNPQYPFEKGIRQSVEWYNAHL